ncbi:hypothetical protein AU468_02410 [Alkalispirochaeta sphaeroplastigenens]|uniref:Uncharacterized protein n=1 Tax=Alkalispirochaeta sphaeroplastigenens TaxID=1187066 RepID=A0A2S4JZ38_9SPIO|nr:MULTISPECIES: hypothetical protein [Alkalispirochaeta]POR04769.1 hypothetical protein AU468_02410 [Alkalispirochaeta sphaeroplastigenens]
MSDRQGTPWEPASLGEFLDDPFDRLETQQQGYLLDRLDRMVRRLEDLEEELDSFMLEAPLQGR